MKIKTKLYTKQQIQEAISFWTKILENTSPLIDALVEDFGYDVVFSDKKIIPTLKIIEDIYGIINVHLFNNALTKCPIENDKDGKCKIDNAAMKYYDVLYTDSKDHPTKYILLTQVGQDSEGNIFYPPRIFISDYILSSKTSIIALASMIAHEMIHQYVDEHGNGVQRQYENDYMNKSYDPHKEEFEQWMNIANNKYGLNVTKHGAQLSYADDCITNLKSFAGSDYNINESSNESFKNNVRRIFYDTGYVELQYS